MKLENDVQLLETSGERQSCTFATDEVASKAIFRAEQPHTMTSGANQECTANTRIDPSALMETSSAVTQHRIYPILHDSYMDDIDKIELHLNTNNKGKGGHVCDRDENKGDCGGTGGENNYVNGENVCDNGESTYVQNDDNGNDNIYNNENGSGNGGDTRDSDGYDTVRSNGVIGITILPANQENINKESVKQSHDKKSAVTEKPTKTQKKEEKEKKNKYSGMSGGVLYIPKKRSNRKTEKKNKSPISKGQKKEEIEVHPASTEPVHTRTIINPNSDSNLPLKVGESENGIRKLGPVGDNNLLINTQLKYSCVTGPPTNPKVEVEIPLKCGKC